MPQKKTWLGGLHPFPHWAFVPSNPANAPPGPPWATPGPPFAPAPLQWAHPHPTATRPPPVVCRGRGVGLSPGRASPGSPSRRKLLRSPPPLSLVSPVTPVSPVSLLFTSLSRGRSSWSLFPRSSLVPSVVRRRRRRCCSWFVVAVVVAARGSSSPSSSSWLVVAAVALVVVVVVENCTEGSW